MIKIFIERPSRNLIFDLERQEFDEIFHLGSKILETWLKTGRLHEEDFVFVEDVISLQIRLVSLLDEFAAEEQCFQKLSIDRQILSSILETFLVDSKRHGDPLIDNFIKLFSIFVDRKFSFLDSIRKSSKKILASDFYRNLLTNLCSTGKIDSKTRFFIGTIGALATRNCDLSLQKSYRIFLEKFLDAQIPSQSNGYFDQQQSWSRIDDLSKNTHNVSDIRVRPKYLLTSEGQSSLQSNEHVNQRQKWSKVNELGQNTQEDIDFCARAIFRQLNEDFFLEFDSSSLFRSIFVYVSRNEARKNFLFPSLIDFLQRISIKSKSFGAAFCRPSVVEILLENVVASSGNRFHQEICILLALIVEQNQIQTFQIEFQLTRKTFDLLFRPDVDQRRVFEALRTLFIHRSIQDVVVQTFLLSRLIEQNRFDDQIRRTVLTLSFHPEIVEQLKKRHQTFLLSMPDDLTSRAIQTNLQFDGSKSRNLAESFQNQIFLLFSVDDEKSVEKFRRTLVDQNFRFGNVENSRFIIFFVSEQAKHDPFCQLIVRQALVDEREIIFCLIREPCRFDDWFENLRCHSKNFFNLLQSNIEIIFPIIDPNGKRFQRSSKSLSDWSSTELIAWAKSNRLSPFEKVFQLYDGRRLLSLSKIYSTNPTADIINKLRVECRNKSIKPSFQDFTNLQTALESLLRQQNTEPISTRSMRYVYPKKKRVSFKPNVSH